MTMLSSSVFVGLTGVGHNLRAIVEEPLAQSNSEHFQVSSPLRLKKADQDILNRLSDLAEIEYGQQGVFLFNGKHDIIVVHSLPKRMSTLQLTAGRLAAQKNEIVLDEQARKDGINLGDTLSIRQDPAQVENGDNPYLEFSSLTGEEFLVVGFANSPRYLGNSSRGTTTIGDGSIDYFGYVTDGAFVEADPDIAYLRFGRLADQKTHARKFRKESQKLLVEIEDAFADRPTQIREEIITEAKEEIADGRAEVQDGWDELAQAEADLAEANQQLQDGWEEYRTGLQSFKDETAEAERKLVDSESQLAAAHDELTVGEAEYQSGLNKYQNGLQRQREGEKQLDEAGAELAAGYQEIAAAEAQLEGITLEFVEAQLAELETRQAELDAAGQQLDETLAENGLTRDDVLAQAEELPQLQAQVEAALAEAEAGREQAQAAVDTLNELYPNLAEIVAVLTQTRDGLQLQIDELTEQRVEKETQVNELEIRVSELTALLEVTEDESERQEIQNQIDAANVDLTETQQAIAVIDAQLAELEPQLIAAQQQLDTLTAPQQALEQAEAAIAQLEAQAEQLTQIQQMIEVINGLGAAQQQIDSAREDLLAAQVGLQEIAAARQELAAGEAEYEAAKTQLARASRQLKAAAEELAAARKLLDDGNAKYQEGLRKLAAGRAEFESATAAARAELAEAHQKLTDSQAEYDSGLQEYQEELPQATADLEQATVDLDEAEAELANVRIPVHSISGRYGNYAINTLESGADSMDGLTAIFASAFYLIAMLITFTTTTRMVDEERTQIGTMKALGYSRNAIAQKYLTYGTSASAVGGLLGIFLGHFVLTRVIVLAYLNETYLVDQPFWSMQLWAPVAAVLLSVAVTLIAAWISVRNSMRENAASLMRPKATAAGNRVLLERIKPLWSRLGFTTKVTLRNATAKKSRMFMTLVGVLGCTALMIMGFGIRTSVSAILEKQVSNVDRFDMQVVFNEDAPVEELAEMRKLIDANSELTTELFLTDGTFVDSAGMKQEFTAVVPFDVEDFYRLHPLQDRESGQKLDLVESKVIITEWFSVEADLADGDQVTLSDMYGVEVPVTVGDITENYVGHYIFLTPEAYQEAFGEAATTNTIWLKANQGVDLTELKEQLTESSAVLMIYQTSELDVALSSVVHSLNAVVFVIIAISALLAFVVLFNLTNLNVAERMRELSTIKVLGFRSHEVTNYIYRETWLLSLIGILIGFAVGKALHYGVVMVMSPPAVMIDPALEWPSYLGGGLLTVVFTLIVMLLVHRSLKKVDMVEALKANE